MPVQALILAAGKSERFFPLGDKNFFEFNGKTLLAQQIQLLKQAGIRKLNLVGNPQNFSQLQKSFPQANCLLQKNQQIGMAGAILASQKILNQPTLILSNNDQFDLKALQQILKTQKTTDAGAILAQKVQQYFPGGYLKIKPNNYLQSIIEKPKSTERPSDLINLVCHFFQNPQALIRELKKLKIKKEGTYEQALTKLSQTQKIKVIFNPSAWQPIKYPWHILNLVQNYLNKLKPRISSQTKIHSTALIENSYIAPGVEISPYALIKNSYIGKNSFLGSHILIRDSLISENSLIGAHTEVARSFLGPKTSLHRNYLGDSVIHGATNFGAGAITANLRLDKKVITTIIKKQKTTTQLQKFGIALGKNCEIGVNTTFSPGILIGKKCFIGSNVLVEKNLPVKSFYLKQEKNKLKLNNYLK